MIAAGDHVNCLEREALIVAREMLDALGAEKILARAVQQGSLHH
jgi:hypothetical protein